MSEVSLNNDLDLDIKHGAHHRIRQIGVFIFSHFCPICAAGVRLECTNRYHNKMLVLTFDLDA